MAPGASGNLGIRGKSANRGIVKASVRDIKKIRHRTNNSQEGLLEHALMEPGDPRRRGPGQWGCRVHHRPAKARDAINASRHVEASEYIDILNFWLTCIVFVLPPCLI